MGGFRMKIIALVLVIVVLGCCGCAGSRYSAMVGSEYSLANDDLTVNAVVVLKD